MNKARGLWRGKDVESREWATGFYSIGFDDKPYIEKRISRYTYEVDPSTLGECTGLRDKNGKLIFEGDVIDYENGDGIYTYMVAWDNEYSRFAIADDWFGETKIISDFEFYSPSKCTVIGNIHDNPELLSERTN